MKIVLPLYFLIGSLLYLEFQLYFCSLCILFNQLSPYFKAWPNDSLFLHFFHWLSSFLSSWISIIYQFYSSFLPIFCFFNYQNGFYRPVIICLTLITPTLISTSILIFGCFLSHFGPVIPLGRQPGSLLHHQCHPFLCKSWCLHTKLPICTLPALRCLHGGCGPEEHAPAAGGSTALRRPARPLPAGPHSLSTRFPR